MKFPLPDGPASFSADAIQRTIARALASAGLTSAPPTTADLTTARVDTLAPTAHAARPHRMTARAGRADPASSGVQHGEFSSRAGTRAYKLYVPLLQSTAAPAMIVMLHGCTQSAADFAAGTQMNRLADEHGFLVLYPEQTAQANASKCWNWFKPEDQRRGSGEPALIAGMVLEVAARQGVDPGRIFVAGLSAGAAMAVVLGETYPELFAGVGVHSGLPYASAHDISSALAAMRGGSAGGLRAPRNGSGASRLALAKASRSVPVIVFHGDQDATVQADNAVQIVRQAEQAHAGERPHAGLQSRTEQGAAPGGRRFTRSIHTDASGQIRIEQWTVHGAGHAWSGGHASGSYTDASGPDASAEMVRFFMALPPAAAA